MGVNVVVGDATYLASHPLTGITVSSSNSTVMPSSNLTLSGSGNTRTLNVAPILDTLGTTTITLTAHFSRAPGLYVGNHVAVLGIAVGRIEAVTPGPSARTVWR